MKLIEKLKNAIYKPSMHIVNISELKDFYVDSNIGKLDIVKVGKEYSIGLYVPFIKLNDMKESINTIISVLHGYDNYIVDIDNLFIYMIIDKDLCAIESVRRIFISTKKDISEDCTIEDFVLKLKITRSNCESTIKVLSLMLDGYIKCITTLHKSIVYSIELNPAYIKLKLSDHEVVLSKLTMLNVLKNSLYYDIIEVKNNDMFIIEKVSSNLPEIYKVEHCPSELDEDSIIIDGVLLKQILNDDTMNTLDKAAL